MALLLALLSMFETGLGASQYSWREFCQRGLELTWPLSRPGIVRASASGNPEVRRRALLADSAGAELWCGKGGRVVRLLLCVSKSQYEQAQWLLGVQWEFVRPDMVSYALEDPSGYRLMALWCLLAPFDEEGDMPTMPWKLFDTPHG